MEKSLLCAQHIAAENMSTTSFAQASLDMLTSTDLAPAAILLREVYWSTALEFGAFWMPVTVFKGLEACEIARLELDRSGTKYMCRAAVTYEELATVALLSEQTRH